MPQFSITATLLTGVLTPAAGASSTIRSLTVVSPTFRLRASWQQRGQLRCGLPWATL
ncbi:Uncharacterised protein [Mycobacteroides abscessus subsp. abscessus]|nr:Uncharacterised protein [Mycobacteroides abscessus subsp. abscessus]